MLDYNRNAAAMYARKWALSRNPNFYNFTGIGGDCTNFISQCLLAGGGRMNFAQNGWFYISQASRSPSWTSVNALQKFLLENKGTGPVGEAYPLEKLEIGDLIQLKQKPMTFTHTLIITKIEDGQIFVCAHTDDALDRPLSRYNYYSALGIHIIGVRE